MINIYDEIYKIVWDDFCSKQEKVTKLYALHNKEDKNSVVPVLSPQQEQQLIETKVKVIFLREISLLRIGNNNSSWLHNLDQFVTICDNLKHEFDIDDDELTRIIIRILKNSYNRFTEEEYEFIKDVISC